MWLHPSPQTSLPQLSSVCSSDGPDYCHTCSQSRNHLTLNRRRKKWNSVTNENKSNGDLCVWKKVGRHLHICSEENKIIPTEIRKENCRPFYQWCRFGFDFSLSTLHTHSLFMSSSQENLQLGCRSLCLRGRSRSALFFDAYPPHCLLVGSHVWDPSTV